MTGYSLLIVNFIQLCTDRIGFYALIYVVVFVISAVELLSCYNGAFMMLIVIRFNLLT